MSWLGKLFGRKPAGGSAESPRRRQPQQEPGRIPTEAISAYCDRMEREAARTGDKHLAKTAARIRARLSP